MKCKSICVGAAAAFVAVGAGVYNSLPAPPIRALRPDSVPHFKTHRIVNVAIRLGW